MPFDQDTLDEKKRLRSAVISVRETLLPGAYGDEPVIEAAEEAYEHAQEMLEVATEDLDSFREQREGHDVRPESESPVFQDLQEEVDRWEHKEKSLRWSRRVLKESSFTNDDTIREALDALNRDIRALQRYLGDKETA